MPLIEMHVSLDVDANRCKPEARAWIDLAPEDGFASELELPLRQLAAAEWVGAFLLGVTRPQHFLYRVGLVGHPGAEFWLTVRYRGRDRELLTDGDKLPAAKCWLVGTCPLPRPEQGRAAPSTERRTSSQTLIVLDRYRERG